MRSLDHTVCERAARSIGECWNRGATFMILGGVCTRACAYCAGRTAGRPQSANRNAWQAPSHLGLSHVNVITSVDRDDLKDGGAGMFAETIRLTRPVARVPHRSADSRFFRAARLRSEPFSTRGRTCSITTRKPISRLYRMARSGGRYSRTLQLLDRSRRLAPDIPTKTGLMVGLGGTRGTRHDAEDLRAVGCQILTIGQYLRPSADHAPMSRYYHPDEFAIETDSARSQFVHVESGPLVKLLSRPKRRARRIRSLRVQAFMRSRQADGPLKADLQLCFHSA